MKSTEIMTLAEFLLSKRFLYRYYTRKTKCNAIMESVLVNVCICPLNPFDPSVNILILVHGNQRQNVKKKITFNIYSTTIEDDKNHCATY
jgi:hypothetical protein